MYFLTAQKRDILHTLRVLHYAENSAQSVKPVDILVLADQVFTIGERSIGTGVKLT